MARVKFTHDYDYKPTSQATIAYKAGMVLTVKQDCADKAIAAGKAVEMPAHRAADKVVGREKDGKEVNGLR